MPISKEEAKLRRELRKAEAAVEAARERSAAQRQRRQTLLEDLAARFGSAAQSQETEHPDLLCIARKRCSRTTGGLLTLARAVPARLV